MNSLHKFEDQPAPSDSGLAHRFLEKNCLQNAIACGDIQLYLQPQVSVRTGTITGVEALARWNFQGKDISPTKFIPEIERHGLADQLLVCQLFFLSKIVRMPGVTIAVNVSATQVRPGLEDIVGTFLQASGIQPWDFAVEITESVLLNGTETVISTLNNLISIGIQIHIDDFGMGYSCLNYLTTFPVTGIKIPREFTKSIQRTTDLKIIDGLFRIAKSLGLRIIAEGIETKQQYNLLVLLDCDDFQGYLHSRPMTVNDFYERYFT